MAKRSRKKRTVKPSALELGADPRYVYIMMRRTKKSWYASLTLQSEYKIGIAKDPQARHETVNKAIEGKIILINQRFFSNARRIESMLRLDFIDSNFRIASVGKGGGVTEWHYLTDLEYLCLEFLFAYYYYYPKIMQILFIIVVAILSYAFYMSRTLDLQGALEQLLNN